MTAIVTVHAATGPVIVSQFLMDQGEPAYNSQWEDIGGVAMGETRDFYAHDRKAIMVRSIPKGSPEI
jgi:hypothetical protein